MVNLSNEKGLVALTSENYHPELLLDRLASLLGIETDAELGRRLGVSPTTISEIRTKKRRVSSAVLIRMYEVSKLSIETLRVLQGAPPSVAHRERARAGEQFSRADY